MYKYIINNPKILLLFILLDNTCSEDKYITQFIIKGIVNNILCFSLNNIKNIMLTIETKTPTIISHIKIL